MCKENKLGQEPAFPIIEEQYNGVSQVFKQECTSIGVSKRFYAACAAMQGIISRDTGFNNNIGLPDISTTIIEAYSYADELLKQENE